MGVCCINFFEKILYMLQARMNTPTSFGWFHIMWILFTIIAILILYAIKNKYNNKQLKMVLAIYEVVAFILEFIKQLIWSFNYDLSTNIVIWDYEWYSAPFQLCTTPMYVSLICLFLKDNKIRNAFLSYVAFITILGSFITIIIPDSCFVETIEVNIHTMWLHCMSFVVSIYLLINNVVKINKHNLINAFIVFLIFVGIAELLNIIIYNIGILNGETFNMFYISPYFISTLPIYSIIQSQVPFILFLLLYIISIFVGATIVYFIAYLVQKFNVNDISKVN